MGSVQSFGEKCPVCGHDALVNDFYYKTGEEFNFCQCCGYRKNYNLKRDTNGKLARHLVRTIDLRESFVYVNTADQVSDNGKVLQLGNPIPVTSDMTQENLDEMLHGSNRANIFLQLPGEYQRLTTTIFSQIFIENGQLRVFEPEYLIEEKGGYGVLLIGSEQDVCTSIYSLSEGCTIESILDSMKEEEKTKVQAIVTFSPRGENPQFYNTTPEQWFEECEF